MQIHGRDMSAHIVYGRVACSPQIGHMTTPQQHMLSAQNRNDEYCAPLTSFDWNEVDIKRLGTSSIDTTCTIWDVEVRV